MEINFKYNVGQTVFYNQHKCKVMARTYMETSSRQQIIKYNLKSKDRFIPNVWEEDISILQLV